MGLGWHPLNLFPLIFIGLYLLFYYTSRVSQEEKFKFGSLALGFFVFNLTTTYWLFFSSIGGALIAFLINTLLMSLAWYLPIRFTNNRISRMILTIGLYGVFEYLHLQHWDLSWPWLSIGNGFANHIWMIQWYEYVGPLTGSIWALSIGLIWHFKGRKLLKYSITIVPIIISICIYFLPSNIESNTTKEIKIGLVQPNYDSNLERRPTQKNFVPYKRQFDEALSPLTDSCISQKVDLVVWPEVAYPGIINEDSIKTDTFFQILSSIKTPLLTGMTTFKDVGKQTRFSIPTNGGLWEFYNSGVLIQNDSTKFYHKSRLVPGIEKVPLSGIFPKLNLFALKVSNHLTFGHENNHPSWEVSGVKVPPVICFEGIYLDYISDYINDGAEILTILVNDGWWGNSAGHQQHFALNRITAISFRRQIARSAYTGISGFIDEKGHTISATTYDTRDFLVHSLSASNEITVFARIPYISLIISILIIIFGLYFNYGFKSNQKTSN